MPFDPQDPRDRSAVAALAALGGTARFTELMTRGVTRHALRAGLHDGAIVRPHRGTYALPDALRAERLGTIFRAEPTCVTRCELAGLPVLDRDIRCHLWVPYDRSLSRDSGRPVAEIHLHRRDDVDAAYARTLAGAIDIAGLCTTERNQLVIVDAAIHRGLLSLDAIAEFRISSRERKSFLARYVDPRSESPSETCARLALVEAGFSVEIQRPLIPHRRTDIVVERRLALEVDSEAHHSSWEAQQQDRDRDRQVLIRGLPTMRIGFRDAVNSMGEIVEDVRAALWRRGWRPAVP